MWRARSSVDPSIVRIGRRTVEHWSGSPGALTLLNQIPLHVEPTQSVAALADGLRHLLSNRQVHQLGLVVESAWMPVMRVDTGPDLWRPTDVEGLARHRLNSLQGSPGNAGISMEIRLEYRAGDRFAMAYGLAPDLRALLAETADRRKQRWMFVAPAFSWGLAQVDQIRGGLKQTWVLWPEQDRGLLAHVDGAEIVALNSATPATATSEGVARLIGVESKRTGHASEGRPILAPVWGEAPGDGDMLGVSWIGLSALTPNARHSAAEAGITP